MATLTAIRVHPAIGIARVGNSDDLNDGWFIGPEIPGQIPETSEVLDGQGKVRKAKTKGSRDDKGRIKRQAARFRLYGYYDDGSIQELTIGGGLRSVTWKVHLANQKAGWQEFWTTLNPITSQRNAHVPASKRSDWLTIDAGVPGRSGGREPAQIAGTRQQFLELSGTFQVSKSGSAASPVSASVTLGHARADDGGRLVVLGGYGKSASPTGEKLVHIFNNDGWYDDTSDGPIEAEVTLSNGNKVTAIGAWLIVGPPRYAPAIDSTVTLYDVLEHVAVEKGLKDAAGNAIPDRTAASYAPSFIADVAPILRRAIGVDSVQSTNGAHARSTSFFQKALANPADLTSAGEIFKRLRPPNRTPSTTAGRNENMPSLSGYGYGVSLTPAQYAVMEKWKDGNATVGASPTPSVTPAGLDRAALEGCIGASFYPGIEAGWFLLDGVPLHQGHEPALATNWASAKQKQQNGTFQGLPHDFYLEAFRFDLAKLRPGDLTKQMALPWQADFEACKDNWWPSHRPNQIYTRPGHTDQRGWVTGVAESGEKMVARWQDLGFIAKGPANSQGVEYFETERNVQVNVRGATANTASGSVIDFGAVPKGRSGDRTVSLPIIFEGSARSPGVTLTFRGTTALSGGSNGFSYQAQVGNLASVTVPDPVAPVRTTIWVQYTTGAVGDSQKQQIVIDEVTTGKKWTFELRARTAANPKAAVTLVLDRSGSMGWAGSPGFTRIQMLQAAAKTLANGMLAGDGLGVVSFNDTATTDRAVSAHPGSSGAIDALLNGLTPGGFTGIGAGMVAADAGMGGVSATFQRRAMVVFSDGEQNRTPRIEDVKLKHTTQVYAVGLGQPQDLSASALGKISGNSGRDFLVTGSLKDWRAKLRLLKFFTQILAGVNNRQVVLDPDGSLQFGDERRIGFQVARSDRSVDAIVLTPRAEYVEVGLEGPTGQRLFPGDPAIEHRDMDGAVMFRVDVARLWTPEDYAGEWTVVLRPSDSWMADVDPDDPEAELLWSAIVHAESDLEMDAGHAQRSFEPGAEIRLWAELSDQRIPLSAQVEAEVESPNGRRSLVALTETSPGAFEGDFRADRAGAWQVRLIASGRAHDGSAFTREKLLTPIVWFGGDSPAPAPDPAIERARVLDERLAHTLRCAIEEGALTDEFWDKLHEHGIDGHHLRECSARFLHAIYEGLDAARGDEA